MENKFKLNVFSELKIRDKFVLITDSGSWVSVSIDEYEQLKNKSLSSELYNRLEDKGIIITDKNERKILESIRDFYTTANFLRSYYGMARASLSLSSVDIWFPDDNFSCGCPIVMKF